jgi:hypothetical protein
LPFNHCHHLSHTSLPYLFSLVMSQSILLSRRCASLSQTGCYYGKYKQGDKCPGYVAKTANGFKDGYRRTCSGNGILKEIPAGISKSVSKYPFAKCSSSSNKKGTPQSRQFGCEYAM